MASAATPASAALPTQTPPWTADLDAYAAACAAAASGPAAPPVAVVAAALRTAGRLGAALRASPTSAEAWWAFLAHEEAFALEAAAHAAGVAAAGTPPPPAPRLGALPPHPAGRPAAQRLLRLYEAATRAVPRGTGGPAFARIWLGYARRQWARAEDDGRDAFKALRSHRVGCCCAYVAGEWAALEASVGGSAGRTRAAAILAKARAAGATPTAVLDVADAVVEGRPVPPELEAACPRWHEAPLVSRGGDETTSTAIATARGPNATATLPATGRLGGGGHTMTATAAVTSTATGGGVAALPSTTAAAAATPGGSAARPRPSWAAAAPAAPTPTATLRGAAGAPTPGTTRILPPSTFKVPRRIGAAAGTPLAAPARPATRAAAAPAAASTPPPPGAGAAFDAAAKRKAVGEAGISPAPPAAAAAAPTQQHPAPGAAVPKRRSPDPAAVAAAAAAARPATTRPPLATVQAPSSTSSPAVAPSPAPGRAAAAPPSRPTASPAAAPPARPPPPAAAAAAATTRRPREDEASIVVRGTRYAKLECVGRGGSSKVFKVMAPSRKIYALKRIRLAGRDAEAAAGFMDEIGLLTRLRGQPGIVQLVDAEVVPGEGLILMVLEYGDIDLARLLARQARCADGGAGAAAPSGPSGRGGAPADAHSPPTTEPDENFIRLYWQQMLRAVSAIHAARIVHSDLKPANFLVVQGTLKLIDFGIAKAIHADTTSIARESQVGTLNYMSPEAILGGAPVAGGRPGCKVGRPSDVWSLGCILYQMVYGRTPFAHLPFIQKMHAITDDRHAIAFPPVPGPAGHNAALADCLRRTLDRNPRTRITIPELLAHPFLRPTAAAAGGAGGAPAPPPAAAGPVVGLTRQQLADLLAKAAAAGSGGLDVDGLLAETVGASVAVSASTAGGSKPGAGSATAAATAGMAALRFDDTAARGGASGAP